VQVDDVEFACTLRNALQHRYQRRNVIADHRLEA